MPSTYTLISSNVLSSSAASVTFSAIPDTYTDLVLKISYRNDAGGVAAAMTARFNSNTGTIYSRTRLYGNGSTVGSSRGTLNYFNYNLSVNASGATSNTFSSAELYIPNYTSSTNKPVFFDTATEDNATEAYRSVFAALFVNTTAISSIQINPVDSGTIQSGSSFYLYGIKNS
jgi:hypothetical protein